MARHQLCIIIIIIIIIRRGVYTPSDVNVQQDGTRMQTHRVKIRAPGQSGHEPSRLFIYFASSEGIHTNLTPLHACEGEREREQNYSCIQDDYCIILNYIEILADPQPSTSYVGQQTSSSRGEPQPSTSGQSLPGSDYVLHELGRVELDSDADLKGVLVGSLYYTISKISFGGFIYFNLFLFTNIIRMRACHSLCALKYRYSNAILCTAIFIWLYNS